MGDRGQVHIKDEGVYLYTHWGATELIDKVKSALSKRVRWDDAEYLARIIFSEMVRGFEDGTTGFGIGTSKHGDVWRVISIDCSKQQITIEDRDKLVLECSFNDFIAEPQRAI
jgi:hypothetical protein